MTKIRAQKGYSFLALQHDSGDVKEVSECLRLSGRDKTSQQFRVVMIVGDFPANTEQLPRNYVASVQLQGYIIVPQGGEDSTLVRKPSHHAGSECGLEHTSFHRRHTDTRYNNNVTGRSTVDDHSTNVHSTKRSGTKIAPAEKTQGLRTS